MAFDERLLSGIGVFAAAVEYGSFAGAAEVMGLTTSGASRAISRLEARIGVRLFTRSAKGVSLTSDGRHFYDRTKPHLRELAASMRDSQDWSRASVPTLHVLTDSMTGHSVVVPALTEFLLDHPNFKVRITVCDSNKFAATEPFDVAIQLGHPTLPGAVKSQRWFVGKIIACASPGYLERHGRPAAPSDLTRHACLQLEGNPFESSPFWTFSQESRSVTVPIVETMSFNEAHGLVAALINGAGIGRVFDFAVAHHLACGRLSQLLPDWTEAAQVYIHHPAERDPAPYVAEFTSFLLDLEPGKAFSSSRTCAKPKSALFTCSSNRETRNDAAGPSGLSAR